MGSLLGIIQVVWREWNRKTSENDQIYVPCSLGHTTLFLSYVFDLWIVEPKMDSWM